MRVIWTPILVLIATAGLLGLFQNCSNAVPFGTVDYFQALVNSPEFPYEVQVDQLAYMSCAEQEDIYNDGTFFSFRVGAFETGGLRVTPEYRNSIEKVDEEDVPLALQTSAASSGLRIQAAIRTLDNFQVMYVDLENNVEGLEGSDYDNFFPAMGDSALTNILWYNPPQDYVKVYNQAQFIDEYRFEGNLMFMKSQKMETDLRNFFGTRGLITVTFNKEGEIYPVGPGNFQDLQELADSGQAGAVPDVGSSSVGDVRAANNDVRKNVYGVGIQPRFKQPPKLDLSQDPPERNPGSFIPPRILSSVNDVIIDERMRNRSMNQWVCPPDMAFMIVLPSDAVYQDENSNTITRCSMNQDPVSPSPQMKILRQSIYAEDFYIDTQRRCVVPKQNNVTTGSCYGIDSNTSQTYRINYETFDTDGCGFGNINGLCPHYVSVCYRQ